MSCDSEISLASAKNSLMRQVKKGAVCPCCERWTKVYSRKITNSMAYGLILLSKSTERRVHLENYFKSLNIPASIRADIPKLRFWGFILPLVGDKSDGNPHNGYYAVTRKGKQFVNGEIQVQSHIEIYNNEYIGDSESGRLISIKQALGNKFSYEELLSK